MDITLVVMTEAEVIGIICGTKIENSLKNHLTGEKLRVLPEVGVIVVKGDGTWDVYEMGDKLLCDDEVDEELLPVWESRVFSIKFFVFLFLRCAAPFM